MDLSERHQQVMKIVGAALECAPHERDGFLERQCGGNERLRSEVESLLEYEKETDVVSEPIVSIRPEEPERPGRVGPYEILDELGSGGMGDVYLARQEKPVRRRVALKLIHSGLDSHEVVRRFEIERDILARLRHPNIAQLLDGGADEEGRLYFAMEYVDGLPIDEYCDREKLSIRRRLELFRKVCSAVQLAHRNLVVHRDLKPGNVLVDGSGEPKLLDFGIAKLLQGETSERTVFTTAPGRSPMTQAYASPEMVVGEAINTLSDVYSLGVVLYRLLCGRHPYQVHGRSAAEIDRAIREEEPRRPSAVVLEVRGTDPKGLSRELSGDLDCIVMKALRKEPRERYGSVVELSEDILRYLKGLPVTARADTFRYRTGKFVRRHRLALATAAAFLVVVTGLVVALLDQMGRIREERDRANKSHDLFVEIVKSTDPEQEEEVLTPEGIVKRGIDLLGESFARENELQAAVFDSLGRVYGQRGYYDSARRLLEASLEMRLEAFGDDHPLVAEIRLNLADLLGELGEHERAEELARLGLKIQRAYYQGPHIELARAISVHATQLSHLKKYQEAEPLYLESHEMRIELNGDVHLSVAKSFDTLGSLHQRRREIDKALASYRRSQEIREVLLPPEHPDLARSYSLVGAIQYEQAKFAEAAPLLRRAWEIRRKKHGDQHPDVAASGYKLALVLRNLNRYDEAEPLFRQALEARCGTLGDGHLECANVKAGLASVLVARGDTEAARVLALQALETFENEGDVLRPVLAKRVLGKCLAAEGRYGEAEGMMLEGYSIILEHYGETSRAAEEARRGLIELYEAWGKPEKVEELRDPQQRGGKPPLLSRR